MSDVRSLCAPDPGDPVRPVSLHWSTPERRQYPHDSRTRLAVTTGWQRHTLRATYRSLRAQHPAWEARMAVIRLLNLGRVIA